MRVTPHFRRQEPELPVLAGVQAPDKVLYKWQWDYEQAALADKLAYRQVYLLTPLAHNLISTMWQFIACNRIDEPERRIFRCQSLKSMV